MSSFRDTSKKKKKKKEKKKKDGKKKKKSSHKNKSLIDEDDDNNSKSNKRKKEIEDALKEFTNPNELVDPDAFDADFQDGTNASANTPNSKYDSSNIDNSEFGPSGRLNLRGGIDMDDDEKYSGKAITRKELVKNNLGQNNEGEDDDEDDEKTRKKIENAYMQRAATIEFDEQNDMISSSSSDDDDDEYITTNNKNDNTDQYDDGSSNIANELKRIEAEDKRALMKLSASREDDIVRAKHTKNQMALYDDFLRLRISMQSLVSSANRFPQPDIYPLYKQKILKNKNTNANFDTTLNDVMETMSSLLNIQSTLISRNNNVEKNLKKNNKKRMRKQGNADDGSSSSSSSNSSSDDDDNDDSNNVNNEIDRMWKTINETNQDIFNHDREIIDKWDEKIRLQSSASHKALKAVNRTVISQIDALMADKDKIIQRTRTHSVPVKVIGKNDDNNDNSDNILQDDQVYDDNDFYQMQLKEFISSSSINDVERSRLETKVSFKLKKTKRTVDTKASKGRRLKFTPHSKLLNFMAPQPQEECMIDAEGLIGSLFEKTPGGGGGE